MTSIFVRTFSPKTLVGVDPKHFLASVNAEMKDVGKAAEKEMAKPTARWKSPPAFKSDVSGMGNKIVMVVHPIGPQAQKYNMIDYGTPAHVIRPNPPRRFLRFLPKYLASTIPNRLWSRVAKRSGGFVYARIVHHPGIAARDFSGQVYKKVDPDFRRRMKNLVKRELRYASGKGV